MQNRALSDDDDRLIISFRVGQAFYGLDAKDVQEVIMVGEHTSVYDVPDYVYGITNLRGRIVTIVDLSMKLTGEKASVTPESRILIVQWMDEQVGLLADEVGDVYVFNLDRVDPAPANVQETGGRFMTGVYQAGEALLGVLALELLLAV